MFHNFTILLSDIVRFIKTERKRAKKNPQYLLIRQCRRYVGFSFICSYKCRGIPIHMIKGKPDKRKT